MVRWSHLWRGLRCRVGLGVVRSRQCLPRSRLAERSAVLSGHVGRALFCGVGGAYSIRNPNSDRLGLYMTQPGASVGPYCHCLALRGQSQSLPHSLRPFSAASTTCPPNGCSYDLPPGEEVPRARRTRYEVRRWAAPPAPETRHSLRTPRSLPSYGPIRHLTRRTPG